MPPTNGSSPAWTGSQSLQTDHEGLKGVIYAEELHWGCAGIALAISASALCAAGIASSGTPEQIGRWIPEVVGSKGNPRLGAYAVTEPSAGSDVKSLRTTAKRDGDDWILNGTKTFISNGGIADVTVVVATVDPDLGHRGQASFVVTGDNPGLKLGHKESKLGIRASQTAEIVLEDCRVPGDALLGGDEKLQRKLERARSGQRSKASGALATFEITRPTVGASALGIAQAAYEWTLEHLWDRTDEGRPLLQEQRIQQVLADVATEIESARLLVWRAAWMGRNGVPMTGGQGSMSKLKGGDVAMWATTELMDLVGPEAQSTELPAGEVVPGREDLPAVRGHRPDPAAGHRAHADGGVRRAAPVRAGRRRAGAVERFRERDGRGAGAGQRDVGDLGGRAAEGGRLGHAGRAA